MNKTAIKNFSVEARKNLLYHMAKKAEYYGITSEKIEPVTGESDDGIVIGDMVHSIKIKKQREDLVRRVEEKGYEQVMEESAYTWFNRFIALRFMEVQDYLPSGVRVLSSVVPGKTEPDIMTSALTVDLPLDKDKIYELQDNNERETLYKYLLITQCNELSKILPFLFEKIEDYTELLLPDNLLFSDSVIKRLVEEVPEEDFKEVEIIGWLYQFYISEKKDEVFSDLKKNIKISKENIPAATQLFTPAWIVKYMVENSAGRLWLEAHPDKELQDKWKYYIEPAEQEPEVQKQLDEIIKGRGEVTSPLKPEDIKILDPCMGSGHILVYAFEVMYEIYRSAGYEEREIPGLILTKNLYGLDIDDRAAQLAAFAVMMKARSYNRRVFRDRGEVTSPLLNLCSIQDFDCRGEVSSPLRGYPLLMGLCEQFVDGKEFGSLIEVMDFDRGEVEKELERFEKECDMFSHHLVERVRAIVKQAGIMAGKYDVVVTNPPYMGNRGMGSKLTEYLKKSFSDSKSDLFACFIERCIKFTDKAKFTGMITQHSWMFLAVYQNLREKLLKLKSFSSMLHLGARAFEEIGGEVVQSTSFIIRNNIMNNYRPVFVRLVDFNNSEKKEYEFLNGKYRFYHIIQENFFNIPGTPIVYWISDKLKKIFKDNLFYDYTISDGQNKTGDNNKFLRYFWEVENNNVGINNKWLFYAKGGEYRKWYGNIDIIIDWSLESREHYRKDKICRIIPEYLWYKKGITWTATTTNLSCFRILTENSTFDVKGSSVFLKDNKYFNYFLAYLNSNIVVKLLKMFNPTVSLQVRDVRNLPIIFPSDPSIKTLIDTLAEENILISRRDWDSFETSWDFQLHPFLQHRTDGRIQNAFNSWKAHTESQFKQLKSNEEHLNRLFIEIYDLSDELTPEVENKDITIRKASLERDIKSFLSYAVGCMMGRYSPDSPGLIYAGGTFDPSKYKTYPADDDGIIPILSEEYFHDDIVARFIKFLKITFGEESLTENMEFIAQALGKTGNETSTERIRKYFLNDFYKDHLKVYKNTPIYWLFTSGKEKAFNALIYLHRYDKYILGKMRVDYLHELQGKIEIMEKGLIERLPQVKDKTEKRQIEKKLSEYGKHKDELRKYDELLRQKADDLIDLDLDDGVKVNYEKFKGLVGKV